MQTIVSAVANVIQMNDSETRNLSLQSPQNAQAENDIEPDLLNYVQVAKILYQLKVLRDPATLEKLEEEK